MKNSRLRLGKAFFLSLPLLGMGMLALAARSGAAHAEKSRPRQLETTASTEMDEITVARGGSLVAAIGRDDARFAKYGTGGFVYTWDARSLNHLFTIPAQTPAASGAHSGDFFSGLAVSPDGKRLGVSERGARGFAVYDIATRKRLWSVHSWATHSEFSADGRFVALTGNVCGFEYRDAATGQLVARRAVDQSTAIRNFRLSPDGQTVAWMANPHPDSDAIELHRIRDWKLVGILPGGLETQLAQFSPDGQRMILLSRSPVAVDTVTASHDVGTSFGVTLTCYSLFGHQLWQRDYQKSGGVNLSSEDFCDAAFSPDGRTIALRDAGDQNGLLLLDAGNGHELRRLSGGEGIEQIRDSAVAFSADGKRVFGRGGNGVLVWDLG